MDEFRSGLELATLDELHGLTVCLFQRRFNPLDYVMGIDCTHVPHNDRRAWLDELDRRFRFLAADGLTVLKGTTRQLSYRQILLQVCRYFKLESQVNSGTSVSTIALEEEIFLHLLSAAYQKLPLKDQQSLEQYFRKSLTHLSVGPTFYLENSSRHSLRLLLKGGSAVMTSSVIRPLILRHVANNVAAQIVRYQMAKNAMSGGGKAALGMIRNRVMLQTARRGVALNVASYGVIRGVFAVLGPAMWTWFFADLGWRIIATNYGRIIPVIFSLAQIRLLRAPSLSSDDETSTLFV